MVIILIAIAIFMVLWIINSGIHIEMTPVEHTTKAIITLNHLRFEL